MGEERKGEKEKKDTQSLPSAPNTAQVQCSARHEVPGARHHECIETTGTGSFQPLDTQ